MLVTLSKKDLKILCHCSPSDLNFFGLHTEKEYPISKLLTRNLEKPHTKYEESFYNHCSEYHLVLWAKKHFII